MSASSDGERLLLSQILSSGLAEPVAEHAFALPIHRWRFDFAWPDRFIAVEVEGGQWIGGHARGRAPIDAEKYNTAALMGWTVLRFTPAMIKSGDALRTIDAALWAWEVART